FVDRTMNNHNGDAYLNALNINVLEQEEHFNQYSKSTILMSNRFAKTHHYKLGGDFKIKTDKAELDIDVGGFAYDYNNAFPLIYDTDVITHTRTEATLYIHELLFSEFCILSDSCVVDNSKILFKCDGNNLNVDSNK